MCKEMIVSYEDVISNSLERTLVRNRRELMLRMKEKYPELSYPQLGKLFNRDHSAVILGIRKAIENRHASTLLETS